MNRYEGWVIELREKESLKKSFILFFILIEFFLVLILRHHYSLGQEYIKQDIFLELENYSFNFDDKRFDIDIIPNTKVKRSHKLYEDKESLYLLVPFEAGSKDALKVFYPRNEYNKQIKDLQIKLGTQFVVYTILGILFSLLAAFYSLKPLRDSVLILEEFIKDVIHDLNTPVTSMMINLKLIDEKSEEIEGISLSAKNINMLYQNLDSYLRKNELHLEEFSLKTLLDEQVKFFKPLYSYLNWDIEVDDIYVRTDKNVLTRILYNLLSNACKYNIRNGSIVIRMKETTLQIQNDSHGIKHPERLFERFYKESERGLGIGLHIVDKLCKILDISKSLYIKDKVVTFSLDLKLVTLK